MLIKEFATKYQLTNDTVRYYEKEGLLDPLRLENGYRYYDETCEKTIKFIIVLKQLGFTLQEIKMLLDLKLRPISMDCNVASTLLFNKKISNLERKIEFFTKAVQALQIASNLMVQGRYDENKEKIESLVEEMYWDIHEGDEMDVTS